MVTMVTRAPYRWIITADSAEVERLRALHQLPAGYHNRRRWTDDGTPIDTSTDKESVEVHVCSG